MAEINNSRSYGVGRGYNWQISCLKVLFSAELACWENKWLYQSAIRTTLLYWVVTASVSAQYLYAVLYKRNCTVREDYPRTEEKLLAGEKWTAAYVRTIGLKVLRRFLGEDEGDARTEGSSGNWSKVYIVRDI